LTTYICICSIDAELRIKKKPLIISDGGGLFADDDEEEAALLFRSVRDP
jgi:hypothetical protein